MATKCPVCNKSVYSNDPHWSNDGVKWHKQCFKCVECQVLLVLRNAQVLKGTIYCEQHKPREKPSQSADRMDIIKGRESSKLAKESRNINQNVRGELAGQKSQEGVDSLAVSGRMNAGRLAKESRNINQNVRGELAGQKSQEGVDSLYVGDRMRAGQLAKDTYLVNEQIRGSGAGQQQNQYASAHLSAPREE